MKIFENSSSLSPVIIVLIVVGALLILGAIIFLLIKFILVPNKMKREIRDLDRRFQYLHSLLIGQDAQCIKRLEIVSRSNLLYVDIHTKYLRKFKDIRDKYDSHAQNTINNLKDLADEKKYKPLKVEIADAKDVIANYEVEVNSLNADLLKVIKPEEDCRQASLTLKESLRRLKQDYYAKEGDLQLVKESFDAIFTHIENLFTDFEENVEHAQYEDANEILPQIDRILKQVSNAIKDLPNLCALVVNIIPEKISSLENSYEVMVREKYPLSHLINQSTFKEMRKEISILTTRIKQFDLNNVMTKLDDIQSRIEEYFRLFEDERKARHHFEEDSEKIYKDETVIERRFIKLCNNVPEVSKIYIINEAHMLEINAIQESVNSLGNLKRVLDTFIHTVPPKPYSLLVEKMDELKEANDKVTVEMNSFSDYLVSLKEDSQHAFELIKEIYFKAKDGEENLRKINNQVINLKYRNDLSRIDELIEQINSLLYHTPIDVDKVNGLSIELKEISNRILGSDGLISQDKHMQILAENAIVYANRNRSDFSDINQLLIQAEELFNNGEFEQSYILAGNALSKIKSQNNAK